MPRITALYAALLVALFLVLTFRVMALRFPRRIMVGTGGDPALERAARVHANFAEYVPLFLAVLLAAELCGTAAWVLHGCGAAMLAGRAAHAAGMSREPDIVPLRALGMVLTLSALITAAAMGLRAAVG